MPRRAERWLALQPRESREHLEAFAAGINAFAREHPELIGDSVRAVLPVTATDVIEHWERIQYSAFLTGKDRVRGETRTWVPPGSNAWAVAPNRTADGHTLLLANPHLRWSDVFTWFEAQYTAPGIDVSGAALVLSPVLEIAFNDRLGWTHTVNTQDGVDLYELTLTPGGYAWNGGTRQFDVSTHVLRVRRNDGSYRPDTLVVRQSVHGPVVASKPGRVIALSVVGLHGPELPLAYEQWWQMGRARSLPEFQAAVRGNQVSGFNIIYGDRDGHIMMSYGGNTPERSGGDASSWSGIVRGDTSATLWHRLLPVDELPRVIDPSTGWVQNANEAPWWATYPLDAHVDRYPAYVAPAGLPLRPQESMRLLMRDSAWSFEQFLRAANSTHLILADRVVDELVRDGHASRRVETQHAADILRDWDRSADADSRGGVLFVEWWGQYQRLASRGKVFRRSWDAREPLTTPAGLGDSIAAIAALDSATASLLQRFGRIDVAWGDAYRLRRDGEDLPMSGAPGELGTFHVVYYDRQTDGRLAAVSGTSFVFAAEFGPTVRAVTLLGYGNSSRPGSSHRSDQLSLLAGKRFKPAWRSRDDVIAHLERREVP